MSGSPLARRLDFRWINDPPTPGCWRSGIGKSNFELPHPLIRLCCTPCLAGTITKMRDLARGSRGFAHLFAFPKEIQCLIFGHIVELESFENCLLMRLVSSKLKNLTIPIPSYPDRTDISPPQKASMSTSAGLFPEPKTFTKPKESMAMLPWI